MSITEYSRRPYVDLGTQQRRPYVDLGTQVRRPTSHNTMHWQMQWRINACIFGAAAQGEEEVASETGASEGHYQATYTQSDILGSHSTASLKYSQPRGLQCPSPTLGICYVLPLHIHTAVSVMGLSLASPTPHPLQVTTSLTLKTTDCVKET